MGKYYSIKCIFADLQANKNLRSQSYSALWAGVYKYFLVLVESCSFPKPKCMNRAGNSNPEILADTSILIKSALTY